MDDSASLIYASVRMHHGNFNPCSRSHDAGMDLSKSKIHSDHGINLSWQQGSCSYSFPPNKNNSL